MTDLLQKLSVYFASAVAVLVVLQPFAIPLTTVAHSVEVLAKKRRWARLQSVAYWVSKVAGTFAIVDLRNVARAVASVLAQLIALLPPTKAQQIKAVKDAARDIGPSLVLIAALSAVTVTQGCALFRGAVMAGQAACQSELVNAPDVIAEAKVRGVSVGDLANAFCQLVDVAAIFTAEPKPGGARQAMSPRDQAVTLLRAKGEIE